jgi:hypothetical protein
MSEEETRDHSAVDDMIETHRLQIRQMKAANWLMHEQVVEEIAKRLACSVQTVQDALFQLSIETDQRPVIVLDHIYQFLQVLTSYQDKEVNNAKSSKD